MTPLTPSPRPAPPELPWRRLPPVELPVGPLAALVDLLIDREPDRRAQGEELLDALPASVLEPLWRAFQVEPRGHRGRWRPGPLLPPEVGYSQTLLERWLLDPAWTSVHRQIAELPPLLDPSPALLAAVTRLPALETLELRGVDLDRAVPLLLGMRRLKRLSLWLDRGVSPGQLADLAGLRVRALALRVHSGLPLVLSRLASMKRLRSLLLAGRFDRLRDLPGGIEELWVQQVVRRAPSGLRRLRCVSIDTGLARFPQLRHLDVVEQRARPGLQRLGLRIGRWYGTDDELLELPGLEAVSVGPGRAGLAQRLLREPPPALRWLDLPEGPWPAGGWPQALAPTPAGLRALLWKRTWEGRELPQLIERLAARGFCYRVVLPDAADRSDGDVARTMGPRHGLHTTGEPGAGITPVALDLRQAVERQVLLSWQGVRAVRVREPRPQS